MLNAETFVAFGFVLFVGLLAYLGVHKTLNAALDKRADRIKGELAEAERLRAEAEAAAVVAQAHADAEILASEAAARLSDFIKRRTKQAEEKIAAAETQATADVRAAAADAATKAAATVLAGEARGSFGDELVSKSIADLKSLLH